MKTLRTISIIYFSTPTLFFLATWFNYVLISVPFIFFFLLLYFIIKNQLLISQVPLPINKLNLFYLFILSILFCYSFGVGELNNQSLDWTTNNFKFHDLITHPYPVYYPQEKVYLCYYLGFYIIPATAAKISGIIYAKWFVLGWFFLGFYLCIIWVFIFFRRWFVFFILFDGAIGILKYVLSTLPLLGNHIDSYGFIKSGTAYLFLLSPFYTTIYWAPQHGFVALIGIFFILENIPTHKSIQYCFLTDLFFVGCCFFWSPLCTLGLIPFFLAKYYKFRSTLYNTLTFKNVSRIIVLAISLLPMIYYLSMNQGGNNPNNRKFLWQTHPQWYVAYALFVFFYIIIWIPLLKRNPNHSIKLYTSIAVILISPLIVLGKYNDFLARIAIPSHIILALSIFQALKVEKNRFSIYFPAYLILFAVCSISVCRDLGKSFFLHSKPRNTIANPYCSNAHNTLEFLNNVYGKETSQNYQLRKSDFAYKLLKNNQPNPY